MSKKGLLVVVAGPTAVGKTALCVALGKKLGIGVVSSDSRQFYREMAIGTAKPTAEEMEGVPHYFIDSHSVAAEYSAGEYERDALALIASLHAAQPVALLTGGSGMYIDAVCHGIDPMPTIPEGIRATLNATLESEGLAPLAALLKTLDPEYHQQVDLKNPRRVVRALEVCQATGLTYTHFRKRQAKPRPFHILKIALERPREALYRRIDQRMDAMVAQGLFEEARRLYPYKHHNALQTVGYKEVFGYMDGAYGHDEAVRLLKRNSRRYAKRQLTWFRRDPAYHWFHPDDFAGIWQVISRQCGA